MNKDYAIGDLVHFLSTLTNFHSEEKDSKKKSKMKKWSLETHSLTLKWAKLCNMEACRIKNQMINYSDGLTKVKILMMTLGKKISLESFPLRKQLIFQIKLLIITTNHKKISAAA